MRTKLFRTGLTILLLALVSGCASFSSVPPGTPAQDVVNQFGAPTYQCTLEDGSQRLIWSQQPFGQRAWATNTDTKGRIDGIRPILTDEHFSMLRRNTWTPEQLLCEFGPPAERAAVGLPSVRQIVWSYRYLQDGVWNSLMHVYLGQDGSQVTRFHPGPDPMYERNRFGLF